MDVDAGSESAVEAIARTDSAGPHSPIPVDDASPPPSVVAETPRERSPSEKMEVEPPEAPTVHSNDQPLHAEVNTNQQPPPQHPLNSPSASTHNDLQPPQNDFVPSNSMILNVPPAPPDAYLNAVASSSSTTAIKPKPKVHKPRSPSPPVIPPPPPPPLTVRLAFELGGPNNYSVNILELTKETGQRHPTPPPIRRDSDTSSDEDDEEDPAIAHAMALDAAAAADAPKRRRRRRRNEPDEYYDTADPFIDDTDIGIDAPTHFAQTKQKGFYVNSGDVTLVLDEPHSPAPPPEKKPRKRRAFIPVMPSFLAGKGKPGAHQSHNADGGSSSARSTPPPVASTSYAGGEPPIMTPSRDSTMGHTNAQGYPHHDHHLNPIIPPTISVKLEPIGMGGMVPRLLGGEGTKDSPLLLDDTDGADSSNSKSTAVNGVNAVINGHGSVNSNGISNGISGARPSVSMSVGDVSFMSFDESPKPSTAKRMKMANGESVSVLSGGGSNIVSGPSVNNVVVLAESSQPSSSLGVQGGVGEGKEGGRKPVSGVGKPVSDGGERKRKHSSVEDEPVFSPAILKEFQHLRDLVKQADFSVRSKFPQQLRAPLAASALKAIELEEYGEHFFKQLPEIFPYNKFTMTKLVKRLVYQQHTVIMKEREDRLLEQLKTVVMNGFPAAQQAYKDDVVKWEAKQETKRKLTEEGGAGEVSANEATKKDRLEAPPPQRYKLTDEIKGTIWELVTIINEQASMTNQMHEWEPDNHPSVSDQSMRKNLYQRIVGVFPDGWINTGLISREFSNMKRKVQLAEEQDVQSD